MTHSVGASRRRTPSRVGSSANSETVASPTWTGPGGNSTRNRDRGWIQVAPFLPVSELLHRRLDAPRETRLNEVEVVGLVRVLRVDRDDAPAGEHHADPLALERRADERCQFLERKIPADLAHSGFRVRRGRRRPAK